MMYLFDTDTLSNLLKKNPSFSLLSHSSSQFFPAFISTTRGTESFTAPSISSFIKKCQNIPQLAEEMNSRGLRGGSPLIDQLEFDETQPDNNLINLLQAKYHSNLIRPSISFAESTLQANVIFLIASPIE